MPAWVDAAVDDYCRRMPRELPLEVVEIAPQARRARYDAVRARRLEAQRLQDRLGARAHVVALEVDGRAWDTQRLADWLAQRCACGEEVAFLIGGADGLDPELSRQAALRLSLSALTLPHALARVVLVEQLYRAWTVTAGHPYHRAETPGRS